MTQPMPLSEAMRRQLDAEKAAWEDWADRVARDDPDWGWYLNPADRPRLPWWRRVLKL